MERARARTSQIAHFYAEAIEERERETERMSGECWLTEWVSIDVRLLSSVVVVASAASAFPFHMTSYGVVHQWHLFTSSTNRICDYARTICIDQISFNIATVVLRVLLLSVDVSFPLLISFNMAIWLFRVAFQSLLSQCISRLLQIHWIEPKMRYFCFVMEEHSFLSLGRPSSIICIPFRFVGALFQSLALAGHLFSLRRQ